MALRGVITLNLRGKGKPPKDKPKEFILVLTEKEINTIIGMFNPASCDEHLLECNIYNKACKAKFVVDKKARNEAKYNPGGGWE